MGLKEKSHANVEVAHKLKDAGYYDAAVNRFYYSVFQKLQNTAVVKWQYAYQEKDSSSHASLIHFITSNIDKLLEDEELRMKATRARHVTGAFKKLKDMRVKADYTGIRAQEEDIEEFLSHLKKFNDAYNYLTKL